MDSVEPDGELRFGAEAMLGYLEELDGLLDSDGMTEPVRLIVVGGAAMAVKSAGRVTHDIDVVSEDMTGDLRRAVARISEHHPGLRYDWINDGAKAKRVRIPMQPERIFDGQVLKVDSAGSRYILAMKLVSGRTVDAPDCEHLIRELGISDESELFELIEEAIPERLRTPGMEYFAAERLAQAHKSQRRQRFKGRRARRAERQTRRRPAEQNQPSRSSPAQPAGSVHPVPPPTTPSPSKFCGHSLPGGGTCKNPRPVRGKCAAGHRPA